MEKKEHPSYGIIRIARSSVSGRGTALFGSSIMHNNVIRLAITQGVMERDANEDRFFPKERMKDRLIEVEMSYTQFAEAITSLNMRGYRLRLQTLEGNLLSSVLMMTGRRSCERKWMKQPVTFYGNCKEGQWRLKNF